MKKLLIIFFVLLSFLPLSLYAENLISKIIENNPVLSTINKVGITAKSWISDDQVYVEKHENGEVKFKCPLKNGKYNGLCEFYDTSGDLIQTSTYKKGMKDGEEKIYHLYPKKLKSIGTYREGKKDGNFKYI